MKVQKRINYYHNRHRSDGALIENQRKRIENHEELLILSDKDDKSNFNSKYKKNKNYYSSSININKDNYKNELNLTEENIRNNSIKYINDDNDNSCYKNFPNNENYLNIEYSQASDNLTKNLSSFYKTLVRPLPKLSKKENKNREITDKQLEEENIILTKENLKLEQEINLLKKNMNFYNNNQNNYDNNFYFEEPSQSDIEQLYNINRKLMRENENYKQVINRIKLNKDNEKMINNSLKYKADFLVQNMVSSMKELINLFENDINMNTNINSNITIDNKSYSNIQTENFDNFTQSSFTQDNNQSKDQFSEFNSDINNNINNFIYNDNSRNYKDREINFRSKY